MLTPPDSAADIARREAAAALVMAVERKRCGTRLSGEVIHRVMDAIIDNHVSQAQAASWLATVACMGMTGHEVVDLVDAYVAGRRQTPVVGPDVLLADKHSTGGVGDKTSMIVGPVVAACGLPFAKLSGRGLGIAGGTIDKLESIPGLRLDLDAAQIAGIVNDAGMALVSQSADLAPGDAATYDLRDLIGAVESIPLIAASILSKKFALAPGALVFDVKLGRGALTASADAAKKLARLMMVVAASRGIATTALLTDMNVPLGAATGNAIEVREAVSLLSGQPVARLDELCVRLAGELLVLGGRVADLNAGLELAQRAIDDGSAREVFFRWIARQGGDIGYVERLASRLGTAPETVICARSDGYLADIDPVGIGGAALDLGAGRLTDQDRIDPDAGVELLAEIGEPVQRGQPLARIYGSRDRHEKASGRVVEAMVIGEGGCIAPPVIVDVIQADGSAIDLDEIFR